MRFTSSFWCCLVVGFSLSACGGASPPAESAAEQTPAKPAAAPEAKTEKPAEPAKAEAPKEAPVTRKPAKDYLLGTGWDFVLAFGDSELKEKADADCEKKAKGDPAAKAKCMSAASDAVANDRLKLTTDDKGGTWLLYTGRQAGKDVVYTKLQYELAKEEPERLVLKPVGKDQGRQPMKKLPSEIVLEMPDENSVVLQHPERGKLVFSVKMSGESAPKPAAQGQPKSQ